jgi:hypothetical protein
MKHARLVLVVRVVLIVAVVLGGAAVLFTTCRRDPAVGIRFAPASSPPIDFARLDQELPLSLAELESLSPEQFTDFTQEQIDQVYGRLSAGPIPDGPYDGVLLFPRGSDGDTRLGAVLGGRLKSRLGNLAVREAEFVARMLWKGKVFYKSQRLARTRIEDLAIITPLLGGDTSGIEHIAVAGRDAFLLFPARIYCGQSLLDGRRESIVMDHAFTDELPGYREKPDALAGRNGFHVRDELRMIRPGFYLGRAYLNRIFALNFTLVNQDAAAAGAADFRADRVHQDCWTGT